MTLQEAAVQADALAQEGSERELADYFKAYRKRALLDFLKYSFEKKAEAIFRSHVTEESIAHRLAKNAYWLYKKSLR